MEHVEKLVQEMLPPSCSNLLPLVMERLEEKGLEEIEDFKFINFDTDFSGILHDLQARKLKIKISEYFKKKEAAVGKEDKALSTSLVISLKNDSNTNNLKSWAENFVIDQIIFTKIISRKLEKGQRPSPSEYREMVRCITSNLMDVCNRPLKKHLEVISRKIVTKFPVLQDKIDGKIIGTGYDGLLRKLICRVENVTRSSKKSKFSVKTQEKYGCKNFLPMNSETDEDQEYMKQKLKDLYMEIGSWEYSEIKILMTQCFSLQRKCIVEKKLSIIKLKEEFPFLFISRYFTNHFEILLEVNLGELNLLQEQRITELISFFKYKNVLDENAEPERFLEGLLRYFHESHSDIFKIYRDEDALEDIISCEVPPNPFIAAFGEPYKNVQNCMLYIDRESSSEYVCFKTAIGLWFQSFYVFGLEYPEGCPASAEFIQRALYGINPEKGRKTKKRCRRVETNAKVTKLLDELRLFKSIWKS